VAYTAAADFELPRLVDDRLDAQDQAEFVVHLQPIVFHPVFDPSTGQTVGLAVGQDFAIETGMRRDGPFLAGRGETRADGLARGLRQGSGGLGADPRRRSTRMSDYTLFLDLAKEVQPPDKAF
jgi:hypothetical protein